MKGLDCSGVDRGCNNRALELRRRGRAEETENKAVLEKRERSILVCFEIVEKEGGTFHSHSPLRFMQGIEGKLAFVRLIPAGSHLSFLSSRDGRALSTSYISNLL